MKIHIVGSDVAAKEHAATEAALKRVQQFVGDNEITITCSSRCANTGFMEWGIDAKRAGGERIIYIGMIQRYDGALFEFHS